MNENDSETNKYLFKNNQTMFYGLNFHKTHKDKFITFVDRFFLKALYMDNSNNLVVKKSTQTGITEYLVIRAIVKANNGKGVFYVLPTYQLVGRFVKNRVDKSIEYTSIYKNMIKSGSISRFSESISLKHIGKGSIAFVGSNSTTGFTEYPADESIIDEVDECEQDNLPMAEERLSESDDPHNVKVGNPKIVGIGIDYEYSFTDKKKWFIKCEACNNWINPDFFQHVVEETEDNDFIIRDKKFNWNMRRDVHLMCDKCGQPVNRKKAGEWVKENNYSDISGYHISKLFSTKVTLKYLLRRFMKGLKNEIELQRFYNGDLGLAYTSTGAKLDVEMLNDCKEEYVMPLRSKLPCIAGVDVGNDLYVRVDEVLPDKRTRAVYIGKVRELRDIIDIARRYNIKAGVIDSLPEQRLAKKLCNYKAWFRCFYGAMIKKSSLDIKNKIVTVDRTSTLDEVKENILVKNQILPQSADKLLPIDKKGISEYYNHMIASTRVHDEKSGNYKWVEGHNPDHYFHAENYKNIAKKIYLKWR